MRRFQMKPIKVQSYLESGRIHQRLVLVHAVLGGWAYSEFNLNGVWLSSEGLDGSLTKEGAQKAAAKFRQRLREIHRANTAKWAKKKKRS